MSEKEVQQKRMITKRTFEEIKKDEGLSLEPRLGASLVGEYFSIQTNIP